MNRDTQLSRPAPSDLGLFTRGRCAYQLSQQPNGVRQFVVGIDFGTTSSGTTTGKGSSTSTAKGFVMHKPGRVARTRRADPTLGPKAPTRIAESDHDRWGFFVTNDEASFDWFKLALPHEDELQRDLSNTPELGEARDFRLHHDVKVSGLVESYMRGLWDQCVQDIAGEESMTVGEVLQTQMFVVIGAPANWKLGTLTSLLEAASRADIPGQHLRSKVETCVEPEAAAIGLLVYDKELKSLKLTHGDIFTFLDAGGGTSDAITFQIRSMTPMLLDEYAAADARFCGSVQVDRLIFEHLTRKVKDIADSDRAATLTPAVWFTKNELMELMEPTIRKIIDLVRVQFSTARSRSGRLPKALIVCGGFGQNLYVRAKLEEEIEGWNAVEPSPEVKIHFAGKSHGIQAVSKGCAARAVELRYRNGDTHAELLARVTSRMTRHSYAIRGETVLRSIMVEGRSLSATDPELLELYVTDFVPPDCEAAQPDDQNATAELHILESNWLICSMRWTGPAFDRLAVAFQNNRLVQLGAVLSRDRICFTAYIDGAIQTEGGGFTIT